MTTTEELRLPNDTNELDMLLSERGQEHRVWPSGLVVWHDERTVYEYEPAKNHHDEYWGGILRMTMRHLTPEQAIAATLGDVPRLPYFWTHDGTLHIELPKLPESISVRLPDQRDREVSSARVWQYTRGSEMCHVECFDDGVDEGLDGEPIFTSPTWYLSCGHTTQDSERPNFCPVCGKVVDG